MSDWSWPGTLITTVVDGDTIGAVVRRDAGFNTWISFPVRLRLNRVNAPKASTARGRQATARVRELTADVPCLVVTVKPYKYSGPAHTTGEWMAEVTLPDGTNLSDRLVAEGLAVFWDGAGRRPDDH